MQLAGHGDIIDIACPPGQKPLVFKAAQRPPDVPSAHAWHCRYRVLTRKSPVSAQAQARASLARARGRGIRAKWLTHLDSLIREQQKAAE